MGSTDPPDPPPARLDAGQAADLALPLTPPLSLAAGACRNCRRPWRFELRAGTAERDGRALRCAACGQVLGVFALGAAGMVWLRVAAVDDCPPAIGV